MSVNEQSVSASPLSAFVSQLWYQLHNSKVVGALLLLLAPALPLLAPPLLTMPLLTTTPAVAANSALAMAALGLALIVSNKQWQMRVTVVLILLSLLVILQSITGIYPGDHPGQALWQFVMNTEHAGRAMSPATASVYLLLGLSVAGLQYVTTFPMRLIGIFVVVALGLAYAALITTVLSIDVLPAPWPESAALCWVAWTQLNRITHTDSSLHWQESHPGEAVFLRIAGLLSLLAITAASLMIACLVQSHVVPAVMTGLLFLLLSLAVVYHYLVGAINLERQTERELRVNEQDLARAQHQARMGSWTTTQLQATLTCSHELLRLFHLPDNMPVTRATLHEHVVAADRDFVRRCWHQGSSSQGFDIEYRIELGNHIRWVRECCTFEHDAQGNVIQAFGTIQDISELKKKHQALLDSQAHIRQLMVHNDQVREQERRHIARELHDELGQQLTALRLDISLSRMRFGHLNAELDSVLQSLKGSVDRTIQSTRNVAACLRPTALDAGLDEAARWLLNNLSERTDIHTELHLELVQPVYDESLRTAAFRILQESLTNVIRHANASTVKVDLKSRAGRLIVQVSDDGHGFDPEAVDRNHHFGLTGIRERLALTGGELKLHSAPGQGTVLTAEIPIPHYSQQVKHYG